MSDALRVELADTGIAVSLIEPGPIESSFRLNAVERTEDLDMEGSPFAESMKREVQRRRARGGKSGNAFTQPPEAVARRIRHALESSRPRRRYCVTLPAHLGAWMRRLAPYSLVDAINRKTVRKRRNKPAG